MKRMRVRFSGLCLFHEDDGEIVAWVVDAEEHAPSLRYDRSTAKSFKTDAPVQSVTKCFVEEQNDKLVGEQRTVNEISLKAGEVLSFRGGTGGPPFLPGAISLQSAHPGLKGMDYSTVPAAVIRLNRGRFVRVPERPVIWHNLPGGTKPPRLVRMWTDLIVDGLDSYTLESRTAADDPSDPPVWSLTVELDPTKEARLWILNEYQKTVHPSNAQKALHFPMHYECTKGKKYKPYPELEEPWPCADKHAAGGTGGSHHGAEPGEHGHGAAPGAVAAAAAGGSMFCPDGQYP